MKENWNIDELISLHNRRCSEGIVRAQCIMHNQEWMNGTENFHLIRN